MCDGVDPADTALVASMVGRMIVTAEWMDDCGGRDWTEHAYARLTLDDGRVIVFGSHGYDAWGVVVNEEK